MLTIRNQYKLIGEKYGHLEWIMWDVVEGSDVYSFLFKRPSGTVYETIVLKRRMEFNQLGDSYVYYMDGQPYTFEYLSDIKNMKYSLTILLDKK
jgi:hypothetical protein